MSEPTFAHLEERFGIPGLAKIAPGEGGLTRVIVTAPFASAHIYLHGAQLTSWFPAGEEEVLFLSRQSSFAEGRAIRGGIPVCFPWFRAKAGDSKAPSHGVVRTRSWELDALEQTSDAVILTLSSASDDATRHWWPFDYQIQHRIEIGRTLKLELIVTNTGQQPMRFEEALHTYFRVADVAHVRIGGLDGVAYLDNTSNNRLKTQQGDLIFEGPTDSAFTETAAPLDLIDPALARRLRTEKLQSVSTVVWNPGESGAAALSDLANDEWRSIACVEAANIQQAAITLEPGRRHSMAAHITVARHGRPAQAQS